MAFVAERDEERWLCWKDRVFLLNPLLMDFKVLSLISFFKNLQSSLSNPNWSSNQTLWKSSTFSKSNLFLSLSFLRKHVLHHNLLQLASHFSSTGETPTVRLLTKKVDAQTLSAPLSASKLKSIARGKAADPRKRKSLKVVLFRIQENRFFTESFEISSYYVWR